MRANVEAFDLMADDIGVVRHEGEGDAAFCQRVAYTAARFVVGAACMDDGSADGSVSSLGLRKQGINRRLKKWIGQLDSLRPGLTRWFEAENEGIRAVCNRIIDLGEIRPNGFEGTYLATPPRLLSVTMGTSLLLGFYDASDRDSSICGAHREERVTSGLTTLVRTDEGERPRPESWWHDEIEYRSWESANSYGEIRFANPKAPEWSVGRPGIWVEEPPRTNGLCLAKLEVSNAPATFFAVRLRRKKIWLSKIEWDQAQSLFFHMRSDVGNRAVVRYNILDERHVKAWLPAGLAPGRINRILDAVTWPIEDAKDRNRIARTEALPLIRDLLAACHIGFEEKKNG